MIDMTNNRVPYGLLTDEEKAALHEHEKAGGEIVVARYDGRDWPREMEAFLNHCVYRTVPLPAQRSEQSSLKTQDVIAWEKLPYWVEWVARQQDNRVYAAAIDMEIYAGLWISQSGVTRIDDFPGIVQIGTVDWKDSKQRRPRG
jgi:hypothetical protein